MVGIRNRTLQHLFVGSLWVARAFIVLWLLYTAARFIYTWPVFTSLAFLTTLSAAGIALWRQQSRRRYARFASEVTGEAERRLVAFKTRREDA